MSTDSVIGAIGNSLSEESKAILSEVLSEITGDTAYVDVGGVTAVYGNESSSVITGALPANNEAVSGELKDTNFTVNVDLPANVGINFKGPSSDVSIENAANYFNELIAQALPSTSNNPANEAKSQSLQNAVSAIENAGNNLDAAVRYIELTNVQTSPQGNVTLAGISGANEMVAINTSQLNAGQQLILENLDKVILINQADVVVTGTQPSMVVGDNADQKITGGQGADTLVGGGGNDTLAGGLGADSFGFIAGGNYQIADLDLSTDKIAFSFPGLNNYQDLIALVTSIQETSIGVSYTFGQAGVITLLGIKNSDITADLIQFNIA